MDNSGGHTMDKAKLYTIRLTAAEYAAYRAAQERAGFRSLAEWIRTTLRDAMTKAGGKQAR